MSLEGNISSLGSLKFQTMELKTWTEIDRQPNNLNDRVVTRNFQIPHFLRKGFRVIRLKQIGQNHDGDYCVSFTSLESFGALCDEYTQSHAQNISDFP